MYCEILESVFRDRPVSWKAFEYLIAIKVVVKRLAEVMPDCDEQRCCAIIAEHSSQLIDEIRETQKKIF